MTRLPVTLLLAAALPACGRVLDYPDATAEDSPALCSDGVDNDYDGSADCEDEKCDGFCHEESAAECRDGRDNDGDGLVDAADPRCWLFAPPSAESCAEARGVEIFETFDGDAIGFADPSSSWQQWSAGGYFLSSRHQDPYRRDPMLAFSGVSSPNSFRPDALLRMRPFAGSWKDFELTFGASVPPQGLLRIGIAPMPFVPSLRPPLSGSENKLFAVTLDAFPVPPVVSLDVDGKRLSKALRPTQALCGAALCAEYVLRVKVAWDAGRLRASVTYPDGALVALDAPAPKSLHLPPSRLIVWGGTTRYETPAALDDLRLSVKPDWPCGFRSPVLSAADCEAAAGMAAFGHTVSVAREAGGRYCAFVTASREAGSGPEALTAWVSDEGERWNVASADVASVVLPDEAELVGASVASDDRLHAVIAYRDAGDLRLGFYDGEACDRWGPLERGPALFSDAEAPSYVIAGGRHEVYFTRPPGEGYTQRTLWRVRRDTRETEPEFVAKLPLNVAAPVAVQRAGASDLVLTYPVLPGSGPSGVGLLVGDAGGVSWEPIPRAALLELFGTGDAFPGQKLAFDDDGARSAALAWSGDGGFLLYAGSSRDGLATPSQLEPLRSELAVGVARLLPASAVYDEDPVVPPRACGDGACDANENGVSCEADCPAGGLDLLSDSLGDQELWRVLSNEPEPSTIRYMTEEPPSLNWSSGESTWSIRTLELPVEGDFELSFNLFVGYTDPMAATCSLYVGLATAPEPSGETSGDGVSSLGIFVRADIDSACPSRFHLQAVALGDDLESSQVPETQSCLDEPVLSTDAWHHVVLRRRGNEVVVTTPREDGCGALEVRLSRTTAREALSHVLVGFGGAAFESCRLGELLVDAANTVTLGPLSNHGTIRNLELRFLEPGQ